MNTTKNTSRRNAVEGQLFVMQMWECGMYIVGRSSDVQKHIHLLSMRWGIALIVHLAVATSDMRAAKRVMLASLHSSDAQAEGITKRLGAGQGAFRGPVNMIKQRAIAAAAQFPAAPHAQLAQSQWIQGKRLIQTN